LIFLSLNHRISKKYILYKIILSEKSINELGFEPLFLLRLAISSPRTLHRLFQALQHWRWFLYALP